MHKPVFLVYTDHPMCSMDCADAVCDVLNSSGLYDARMIGPDSYPRIAFNQDNIEHADCIVMPGGWGDSDQFDETLYKSSKMIESYVKKGGRYLGICMGAFFAGHHYFDILTNAKAVQYIKRKNSTTKRDNHDVVGLNWQGEHHDMYFHDGAAFIPVDMKEIPANIIAYYKNGDVAAMIQKYKKGKVGVIGPHPEAQKWWFYSQTCIKDRWKDCIKHDLLLDFVNKLLVQ